MTEETKTHLMQNVYKLANHYGIPNATLVSFKKRNLLLELINTKNETAFKFLNDFIEASIKLDRIENDKEKQTKKPEHWNAEIVTTKNIIEKAEEKLIKFLTSEGIN
ncbi:MAG: helix-turn-helix domain-containing protein [Bacteroidota bacterium]|nr:helix-turn-helix domain-containing protein [Bacteroidota bacterium]MDP3145941.1 helix-turn-helix domain-containing protein [Bacteroidota bacterium]